MLVSICSGLFRIYNDESVAKDESIIHQSSGVKFLHYSRGTHIYYSPFSKAFLKALITLLLVPINQDGLVLIVDPIDNEEKNKYTFLCDSYYLEIITNSTTSMLENISNVFININTDQHQYRVQLEFIMETNEVIYIDNFNTDSK